MYLSIYIYVYRSPNFVWCKPTLPFRPVQAILPFQGRRATSMAKGPSSQRHGWIAWSVCGILSADWYNPIMVTMDCMGCVFSDDIVYYNPIMVSLCFSKSNSESKCFSTDFVTPIWKDNRRLETMSESAPSLLEIAFGLELKVTSYAGVAHNLQRFSYPPVIKRGWEIAEWNGYFFCWENHRTKWMEGTW